METMLLALQQGNTGRIKYRPAWLRMVMQSHWRIHWDEIYAEAKSARTLAAQALVMVGKLQVAAPADPVRQMALASRLMAGTGRPKKTALKRPFKGAINLELFS
jgi:hypothetical protein